MKHAAQNWQALQKLALLGSAGRNVPIADLDNGEMSQLYGAVLQQLDASIEQKVLQAAAVMAWAQQVAALPSQDTGALEEQCAANLGQTATSAMFACLQRLLQEDLLACLPLWLHFAAAQKIAAPEIFLPRLLDLGRQNVPLRAMLMPVLDQRGRWLAERNPAWKWLAQSLAEVQLNDEIWRSGSLEQRVAYLHALRQHDAAQARSLLQAALAQEKASQRASLLACLGMQLSLADEALLESLLDDKAKSVRQAAQQLLARLPNSGLQLRMRERARSCVQWGVPESAGGWLGRMAQGVMNLLTGTPVLHVNLPTECDASMQRDGIEEKAPAGQGERAWWLRQILASLPVQAWCSSADGGEIEASQLLASFANHEWRELLWAAAEQACLLHQDANLAQLLLKHGPEFSLPLFRLLDKPARLALLFTTLQQLQQQPLRIREVLPRYQDLFDAPELQLDASMSQQLLATLHAGVCASEHEHDSHSLRHCLLQMLVKLDLASLQAWWHSLDEWDRSRYAGYGTHFLPEKINQIIAFRQQLVTAFSLESTA